MKKNIFRNTADIPDHELRIRCLTRCLVRFVVEKYGGKVEIDPQTNKTEIAVPHEREEECIKELRDLLDYAYS